MWNKLQSYFRLWGEKEDSDELHTKVMDDIRYRGTNLWILILAILVCCVGLNIDSIPVVIGAMLISPLMGPINGIGFGVATNDGKMLKSAFTNIGFAVSASVIASILYFLITPISAVSTQLLSRTNPTVYDGIVAFFGGVAGMLALGSRLKGNVIPGVAIATALMPPLCTVGFGVATWQITYILGAFYLFIMNVVCMVLGCVLIAQILRFPIRRDISDKKKKQINSAITAVVIITIIPSVFLAYRLLLREEFKSNATNFINEVRYLPDNYIIRSNVDPLHSRIELVYAGLALTQNVRDSLIRLANDFSLKDAEIKITEGFAFGSYLHGDETQKNASEIDKIYSMISESALIQDSLRATSVTARSLLREISAIYPKIEGCSYSSTTSSYDYSIEFSCTDQIDSLERAKIGRWLGNRLVNDNINISFKITQ